MKRHAKILELMLTNWAWAMSQDWVCAAALMARRTFGDELSAKIAHALIVEAGDWRAAAKLIDKGLDAVGRERLQKFRQWAEKLTAPRRRGLLLEWKG